MQSTDKLHVSENGQALSGGRRQTSSSTRLLVFLVLLFALATVTLAIVMGVTYAKAKDNDNESGKTSAEHGGIAQNDEVCLTEGCVLAAARVSGAIDRNVHPCDNFFEFACGTWVRKHVIPEDKGSYGTFTQLRDDVSVTLKYLLEAEGSDTEPEAVKKIRKYYKGCLDTEILEKLDLTHIHKYMEDLGGWPLLYDRPGGRWQEAKFNLKNFLVTTRKGTSRLPLMEVYVTQDDKKPTKHILALDQPSLGMPSREYLLKERNDTVLMAYQNYWKKLAVGLGATEVNAETAAKKVVDLEIDIANITVPKEQRRDADKLYNLMKVGDLSRNFTGIDWLSFINGVMGIVNMTITDEEPIVVYSPEYYNRIFDVLHKYDNRTIADYVVGRRVMGKVFYLPERIRDLSMEYSKILSGTSSRPPRWQSCADGAKDTMPSVVGRMFVEETFHQDAKEDVLLMINNLKSSFKEMLDKLQWMDDTTKTTAREKADAVDPRIGYPDEVYNTTILNHRYENVTVYEDPLQTLISLGEDAVKKNLMILRRDYDRTSWGMSPATVNAYYSPSTNQITFPAAILQPPFYIKSQPSYLNYGGIGYVIGHELTHGFDDQGRRFDKDGNLKQWWSDEAIDRFKVQAQCIIDQYSNFTVPGTNGIHLNGINTLGENIADNGGIKESFQAYRELIKAQAKEEKRLPGLDYTPNQLFFLNAAQVWCENMRNKEKIRRIRTDPHSLDMYRVLAPLQNFDEFSKAFNCPKTSYMNKQDKCSVW